MERGCPALPAWCCSDRLLVYTVAAVALGFVTGFILIPADLPEWAAQLLGLPGDCFLRMLKLLVIPLVTVSILGGVMGLRRSGGGDAAVGTLAKTTLGVYCLTYLLAMGTGITLVTVVRPGENAGEPTGGNATSSSDRWQCRSEPDGGDGTSRVGHGVVGSVRAVAHSVIADNLFKAAADGNILGLIAFSAAVGCVLPVNTGRQPLTGPEAAITGANAVVFTLVDKAMWFSPLGIFSLISGKIVSSCDVQRVFSSLAKFIATVAAALAVHAFVWLPLVFFLFTRRSPWKYFKTFARSVLTALALSSSAATLPVTMECAEAYGVRKDVSEFVLVLGSTVNMDGTAMYEAACALFIAQRHGVALSVGEMVVIAITGSLSAVGAAAIPSAGLVSLLMVLQAVDMEQYAEDIALVLVVDWFLDRLRTAVNVMGDGVVCCLVHHRFDTSDPTQHQEAGRDDDGDLEAVAPHFPQSLPDEEALQPFLFSPGDLVAAETASGLVTGVVVSRRTSSPTCYSLRFPDGLHVSGWRSEWLQHDPSLIHSRRRANSASSSRQNPLESSKPP